MPLTPFTSMPATLARPISTASEIIARPLERGAVERRAGEGEHAVDIELGRLELGIEPRRLRAARAA